MSVHSGLILRIAAASMGLALFASSPLLGQEEPAAPASTQPAPAVVAPIAPIQTPVPAQEIAPTTTTQPTPTALPTDPVAPPAEATAPADPTVEATTARQDLDAIEASINLSRERSDALKAEIAAMQGDRDQQNAALIAAAQRVKLAEIEITDVEDRLSALIVQELEVRGRLDGADSEIANVLAALERISLNPPPALIVDPADALGSARSALLIAAIVPQLRARADAVTTDLKTLTDIKAAALTEEATLKANYDVLGEEQLRIATLILARKEGVEVMTSQLAAEEQEAIQLATRATTLKELINSLSERMASVSAAVEAAGANIDGPVLAPDVIRTALANTARTEPAMPFGQARGYLTMPANGVNVVDFGAGDGFGGISQGLSLVTRAEAQVVAPSDGWVLYKGPYLNYGQIIILNTGQNYTALLAGLETVTVDIGQFVLMGEPLGTMGSRTIGRTVTTNAGASQPTLYIELRKDNEPIDPTGWWAPQANTTQSG